MRLFLGIPLAPIVTNELTKLEARLRSTEDNLRWSPPETWHVTLQFLGSTDQQHYDCMLPRLREIHLPHFPIRLESTGIFDHAGIFYVDVRTAPALLVLQQAVIAATTPADSHPKPGGGFLLFQANWEEEDDRRRIRKLDWKATDC